MRRPLVAAATAIALHLASAPAQQPASRQTTGVAQEPLRVDPALQELKLLRYWEPVCPKEAAAGRISGAVVLEIEISELGEVVAVRPLQGSPELAQAAAEAVRQWRYQPTVVNAQMVRVITTVSLTLSPDPQPLVTQIDETGNLRVFAALPEATDLARRIEEHAGSVRMRIHPDAPFGVAERTLQALQKQGMTAWQIAGPFEFEAGRLYCRLDDHPGDCEPPALPLDLRALSERARSRLKADPGGPGAKPADALVYRLFVRRDGEVAGVRQLAGPKVPEVEATLARTRAAQPGKRGAEPIAAAVTVTVPLAEPPPF